MTLNPDAAAEAFEHASASVRKTILAEAEKRVQATIGRLDALNQRLSGMAALQFAGAAVATTLTTNADKLPSTSIYWAALAAAVFVAGGVIACTGLFSGKSVFPGEAPSWWLAHGAEALARLDEEGAQLWLFERHEAMISSLLASVNRRATRFNLSVLCGAIAGALVASAAICNSVLPAPQKEQATPTFITVISTERTLQD